MKKWNAFSTRLDFQRRGKAVPECAVVFPDLDLGSQAGLLRVRLVQLRLQVAARRLQDPRQLLGRLQVVLRGQRTQARYRTHLRENPQKPQRRTSYRPFQSPGARRASTPLSPCSRA